MNTNEHKIFRHRLTPIYTVLFRLHLYHFSNGLSDKTFDCPRNKLLRSVLRLSLVADGTAPVKPKSLLKFKIGRELLTGLTLITLISGLFFKLTGIAILGCAVLPEAATRKRTVSMPKAYEK